MKVWIRGARLRTLPLAIAPVIMGAGTANAAGLFTLQLVLLALAVAVFLQIGVNYANDYSDGIRGTDKNRVGPARLTGGGLAKPKQVLLAAMVSFGLAAVAGLIVTFMTEQWWFIAVGVLCLVAAWFYTGGKKPYGYAGLGEVVVFIFFGLVATIGTDYIQVLDWNPLAIFAGCAAGCFAVAVLLINNVRDIETDKVSGKRTLSVRIGRKASLVLFDLLLLAPFVIVFPIWAVAPAVFLVNLLLLPVIFILIVANTAKEPKDLIRVLQLTSFTSLLFAIGFTWGLTAVVF